MIFFFARNINNHIPKVLSSFIKAFILLAFKFHEEVQLTYLGLTQIIFVSQRHSIFCGVPLLNLG